MPRRPPGSDATSVWLRPAAAGRKTRPAFSRDQITRVAIDLADQHGLTAVSMRRVATRIGSAPTSLYWYFSNKSQLYELMVDAVVGEIELPEQRPGGGWRADLASIASATRVVGRHHPWLAPLGIPPVPGPLTTKYGAAVFRALERFGLDPATQVNILAAVNNYVSGFLQRESGWWAPAPGTTAMTAQREASPTGRPDQATADPSVTPQHLGARAGTHSDESFTFGLDCLLDGIAAHIARATDQHPPAGAQA